MRILIPTSTTDFDPTEVAVPWLYLSQAGHEVVFSTDSGRVGSADPRMLQGYGVGLLKPVLIADKTARDTYAKLLLDPAFQKPLPYSMLQTDDFDALYLPGGHAKGILPYLEASDLQQVVAGFFTADKPVGAVCHGVVTACRAKNPDTGKSVLYGRKTTSLLARQEMLAYYLTRWRLGDYYRTYPQTVEAEVRAALQSPNDFVSGPLPLFRDDPENLSRGFCVRDGNYLSARWPGDIHHFSQEFLSML